MAKVTPIDLDEETPDGFSEHLKEIYESQILESFRRLGRNGLRELDRKYAKKYRKFTMQKNMHKNNRSQESLELEEKYRKDVFDQLQQDLGISFDLRDREKRNVELARVLVFYLGRAQSPKKFEHKIIRRLKHSYATIQICNEDYSWNGLCCELLSTDMFEKLYDNLGKEPSYLIHIFRKNPNLFFRNQWLKSLLRFVIDCVPYDMCHKMFCEVRDENRQTLFFNERVGVDFWKKAYQNQAPDDAGKDLFKALSSIEDNSSQTALHCNPEVVAELLAMFSTPERNSELLTILNAKDGIGTGRTPLDMAKGNTRLKLVWLKEQAKRNRYILYNAPEIIIASASDQREGAQKEAASIQTAFQGIFPTENITSQNTIKKEEIIELIRNKAAKMPSALIVILMAHGEVGAIRESTGKGIITLHEIEKAMCDTRLRNKPKISIVQCCQGRDAASQVFNEPRPQSASVQVDSPTNADSRPPTKNLAAFVPSVGPDFLTLMSCMPGESADRNLFIPTLAEAIKEAGSDTNIIQVFQSTHTKMSSTKMSSKGNLQTPTVQGSPKADFVPKAGFYKQLMSDKQCWVLPTGSLNGFVLESQSQFDCD